MKVKKFNNLWTMGLIIFGVILVVFYIIKIVNPSFIVGVAEIPSIVKFGNYVDTHLWAYYLFNFTICYIGGTIFYCACCRKKKLNTKQNLLHIGFILFSFVLQKYLYEIYNPFNYVMMIILPFLMLKLENNLTKDTFTSLVCCYAIDIISQALSLQIRNIVIMTIHPNIATLTILLIDTWIWRILLYCYFNYKRSNKNEKS